VGPVGGGWYGVRDIGDEGSEKIGTVLQNLNDEVGIFLLGMDLESDECGQPYPLLSSPFP
jgi:hypothetical protein